MIATPSIWKHFLGASHPAAMRMDDKSIDDCTNAALGLDPNLFVIYPTAMRQPIIVHHFSKAFMNALIADYVEEFFVLSGWEEMATPIKINPVSFFANPGDGLVTNGGNRRMDFPGVEIEVLRAADDATSFASANENRPRIHLRRSVAIPPFVAKWLLDIDSIDPHEWGFKVASERRVEADENHVLHEVVTNKNGRLALDCILTWFFFVKSHETLHIDCHPGFPGSKMIAKLSKNIHQSNLTMNQSNRVQRDDRISDAMLERTAAVLQEMSDNRRDDNERNSTQEKGFNKLSSDLQAFILAVGSFLSMHYLNQDWIS